MWLAQFSLDLLKLSAKFSVIHLTSSLENLATQYVVQHGISSVTSRTSVLLICSSWAWWQPCLTSFSYSSTCYSIWESANAFVAPFVELYGACFASCFSALDFCCTYLCFKLRTIKRKRRRRKRDLEEFAATSEEDCELGEKSVT
ncbi:hypothetical protein Sango_2812500 [Sesamum angolense]|uniref:Uncharacterized protein n=1 Tax=Sesamum angolense TaxID=2727404 RepID=A0AAE1T6G8_9LAMI|nr:hypothetical protein Sango_2812500 [Sesamum angolense]